MSDAFIKFDKADIEQSIPARFDQQVEKGPDTIAIKERNQSFTYAELNGMANDLAWTLLKMLGGRPEPIALFLDQSSLLIVAILGVLKAGKFYVSLDPLDPPARNAVVQAEIQSRLIITDSLHQSLIPSQTSADQRILSLDMAKSHIKVENPDIPIQPESLAYVYFTSGSTGRPKGVMDNHRNVLHNVMRYTNSLRIKPEDCLTLIQGPTFSGTVSSLFGALLNGAVICPYSIRMEGTDDLAAWLNDMRITIYHSTPLIFQSFLGDNIHFPSVRLIRLEGDRASRTDLKLYQQYFGPTCSLINGLGTTETGLCRQYFISKETEVTDNILPVGYPVVDMDIMLWDEAGHDVATNQTGEIVVKSCFLSVGYWQLAELTQTSFLSDPQGSDARIYRTGDMGRLRSDGCLEFLGRKDLQLKIKGQKVESAEIEKVFLNLSFISEAAVITVEDQRGEAQLIAYLVVTPGADNSVIEIRRLLLQYLPDALVPTEYVFLDSLPMTINGKINLKNLPEPKFSRPVSVDDYLAPLTLLEQMISEIWEGVFAIDRVGLNDNFLALGGESIKAMQIISRLHKVLNADIKLPLLFEYPRLLDFADQIEQKMSSQQMNFS